LHRPSDPESRNSVLDRPAGDGQHSSLLRA
jgi:hypothetical protein